MSRSGYVDDEDYNDDYPNLTQGRWRGMMKSATDGRRGQQFFVDLLAALEAMPRKRLIKDDLERGGEFCTIGVLGHQRGVDMSIIDPEDAEAVASTFKIASCLAREVVYMNDEYCARVWEDGKGRPMTPEERWTKMHAWVAAQIKSEPQP